MDNRAIKRMKVNIKISFNFWNPLVWKRKYYGTIKNISEKGILISTKTPYFPRDSLLEIYLCINNKMLLIPAKESTIIWRRIISYNYCDSIGVKLLSPPQVYYEFVQSLKAVDK